MKHTFTQHGILQTRTLWTRHLYLAGAIFVSCVSGSAADAENAVFSYVKTLTVAELDAILNEERTTFLGPHDATSDYVLPPLSTAKNAVEIWSVTYDSVVPEKSNMPITASGLVAVPVTEASTAVPSIIYTHGTVFGKYEVPSYSFQDTNPTGAPHYDGAYETRYMVGLFAGNGYTVIAADYFGMGVSASQPEAYFVKGSSQQASLDLYLDVQGFLQSRGILQDRLFVGGWSQGGLNATGLLERLDVEDIPVEAAFTAASPSDPFAAMSGLMYQPRPGLDAVWLNTILALSVFAFEEYYGDTGLAASVITVDAYNELKSIYDRSNADPADLLAMLGKYEGRPFLEFFAEEYRDPTYFSQSRFGRLLAAAETYRHVFSMPIRMYYGSQDEVIKESIGRLAQEYQSVLVGGEDSLGDNRLSAELVAGADHRRTFITAAPAARAWFDTLLSNDD